MRYFLELSYSGKAYNGWQIQQNALSVQAVIQSALSMILRHETTVVGAGRTDTGVHASFYVAHFDTDVLIPDYKQFCYHLNAILPHDIAIKELRVVRDDAHARFQAVNREYEYRISLRKDPFCRDTAYVLTVDMNVDLMNQAALMLLEYDDFMSFCKLHSDNKTTICHLTFSQWRREGDMLIYRIAADRFLRNMVRAIVGTLLDVGRGKLSLDQFRAVVESGSRSSAGCSAPPQGLFLTNVEYPKDLYIDEPNN